MKKYSFIALLFVCSFMSLEAQNAMQALRYSQYNLFGTARYAAQGGAIGALGSDLSSLVTNPAGLGFYRSSELSFSPSFYWTRTASNFMGSGFDDSQMRLNVGSAGFARGISTDNSGIAGFAFAVGYNTLANFNNRTTIRGVNDNSSLLDDFTWHANESPDDLNAYYEQLAFDSYLMPYDATAEAYWHDMQLDGYGQDVYRLSEQSGYIGEYSLSGAVNVSNLLYLGATFGIHAVRFNEEIYHTESDVEDQVLDFNSFSFREFNSTRGWGYTGRIGMILRPFQMLRVGATLHLPTYYRLTDEKYTDMSSTWDNGSGIPDTTATSPNGIYDYRLQSPFRANANASLILFRIATFSAGYEYVDYSSSRLDAYDYKFIEENDQIRQDLHATHNINAGAELRIEPIYLRAGAKYLMSPFSDDRNNAEAFVYTGGIGFRSRQIFFDVSYSYSDRTEVQGLYAFEPGTNEVSINDIRNHNLMFTLGYKF
ncbi:MAG: hypothetical protein ABFS28_00875 [Bacteroidota bacterium]